LPRNARRDRFRGSCRIGGHSFALSVRSRPASTGLRVESIGTAL